MDNLELSETNHEKNLKFDLIIDIYLEFKNIFGIISPFFLANLKINNLTDFIHGYHTYHSYHTNIQSKKIKNFTLFYNNEIEISFNIIYSFFNINKQYWILLCYTYSNLYEIL